MLFFKLIRIDRDIRIEEQLHLLTATVTFLICCLVEHGASVVIDFLEIAEMSAVRASYAFKLRDCHSLVGHSTFSLSLPLTTLRSPF